MADQAPQDARFWNGSRTYLDPRPKPSPKPMSSFERSKLIRREERDWAALLELQKDYYSPSEEEEDDYDVDDDDRMSVDSDYEKAKYRRGGIGQLDNTLEMGSSLNNHSLMLSPSSVQSKTMPPMALPGSDDAYYPLSELRWQESKSSDITHTTRAMTESSSQSIGQSLRLHDWQNGTPGSRRNSDNHESSMASSRFHDSISSRFEDDHEVSLFYPDHNSCNQSIDRWASSSSSHQRMASDSNIHHHGRRRLDHPDHHADRDDTASFNGFAENDEDYDDFVNRFSSRLPLPRTPATRTVSGRRGEQKPGKFLSDTMQQDLLHPREGKGAIDDYAGKGMVDGSGAKEGEQRLYPLLSYDEDVYYEKTRSPVVNRESRNRRLVNQLARKPMSMPKIDSLEESEDDNFADSKGDALGGSNNSSLSAASHHTSDDDRDCRRRNNMEMSMSSNRQGSQLRARARPTCFNSTSHSRPGAYAVKPGDPGSGWAEMKMQTLAKASQMPRASPRQATRSPRSSTRQERHGQHEYGLRIPRRDHNPSTHRLRPCDRPDFLFPKTNTASSGKRHCGGTSSRSKFGMDPPTPPALMTCPPTSSSRPGSSIPGTVSAADSHQHSHTSGADDDVIFVEIGAGVKARFRRTQETVDAIHSDFYIPTKCFGCSIDLFCIADVRYIVCPTCQSISPVEEYDSDCEDQFNKERTRLLEQKGVVEREGVGMGFTSRTLCKTKAEMLLSYSTSSNSP